MAAFMASELLDLWSLLAGLQDPSSRRFDDLTGMLLSPGSRFAAPDLTAIGLAELPSTPGSGSLDLDAITGGFGAFLPDSPADRPVSVFNFIAQAGPDSSIEAVQEFFAGQAVGRTPTDSGVSLFAGLFSSLDGGGTDFSDFLSDLIEFSGRKSFSRTSIPLHEIDFYG